MKLTLMIDVINGWNRLARRLPPRADPERRPPERPPDGRERRRGRGGDASIRCGPRLIRVAYRMLGSVADAEDVVQEAFLRWMDDRPRRGARARGLPAPRRDPALPRPAEIGAPPARDLCRPLAARAGRRGRSEDEDDVTLPLLLALERLSPLERAAFLLHDVFGARLRRGRRDRSTAMPAACRQLASPRPRACPRGAAALPVPRSSAAWRSPRPSSPPRAAATWRRSRAMLAADVSAPCRRRRQAAGGHRGRSSASTTC